MKILLFGNKRRYENPPQKRGHKGGWFEELFREELIRTPWLDVHPFGWGYCEDWEDKTVLEKVEELGGVDVVLTSFHLQICNGFDDIDALKVHFTKDYYEHKLDYTKEYRGFLFDERYGNYFDKMKYDIVFGYASIIIDNLERNSIEGNHYVLPFGVDIGFHRKLWIEKKYDVAAFFKLNAFGNSYIFRRDIRRMLKRMPISLWGKQVWFHEMVERINQSKICVNYSPEPIINPRVTEVLACGTFLLTDYNEEFDRFGYKDGKHLVFYDGLDDLADKVNYYLKDDSRREKIAESGRKFVRKHYNNSRRVKEMVKVIERVRDGRVSV